VSRPTSRPGAAWLPAGLALLFGCAERQVAVTIEPPAPPEAPAAGAPAAPAAAAPVAGPASGAGGSVRAGDESDFVLSREPTGSAKRTEIDWIHVGENWWKFRADFLKMTEAQARERDAAISEKQAPTEFWDRQTAVETALIWSSLCNECHGGRRRVEDAMGMPPPPLSWGRKEGLFFGQRRPYTYVFATVFGGGGPPKEDGKKPMPPWRGKLAREQIWALLYFLEFQSGGIEGRFPPSLYPRMRSDMPDG